MIKLMLLSDRRLSKVNVGLVIVIFLINAFVIITPFLPQIMFWFGKHNGEQVQMHKNIQHLASAPPKDEPNHVIIPSMLLDQRILEGSDTYKILNEGVLRWPASSTPDKGGNTVLLAHRFTYTNPKGAFYFLDKVKQGDEIAIVWNNKTYVYHVTTTKTVPPSQGDILNPTEKPTLTLYTCTPLWLPKDRLVVIAELETAP